MSDNEFTDRINQAINYIYNNLDRNLTVEEIADHCCFSRFYFSRMFKAMVGDGLYAFIKRKKLERAAFLLRTRENMPVTDIALQIGSSPSNFASAFKEYYGVSATEYRRIKIKDTSEANTPINEHIQSLKSGKESFGLVDSKITIRRIERMNLLYDRFVGNYFNLKDFWSGFCERSEARGLIRSDTKFIGISYDDPLVADENKCIYDVCISVENISGPDVHKTEEGFYACYRFNDRLVNLGKAYNELFTSWIPYCRYMVGDRMPLEIYHSAPDENGMTCLDICIPIDNFQD
jgi:AraC family transcriptional regulator